MLLSVTVQGLAIILGCAFSILPLSEPLSSAREGWDGWDYSLVKTNALTETVVCPNTTKSGTRAGGDWRGEAMITLSTEAGCPWKWNMNK